MSKNQNQKKKRLKNYARFSSLTIQMGLIISGGAYFGNYLDAKIEIYSPIFTIIFSLLAIGISLYITLKGMLNK